MNKESNTLVYVGNLTVKNRCKTNHPNRNWELRCNDGNTPFDFNIKDVTYICQHKILVKFNRPCLYSQVSLSMKEKKNRKKKSGVKIAYLLPSRTLVQAMHQVKYVLFLYS